MTNVIRLRPRERVDICLDCGGAAGRAAALETLALRLYHAGADAAAAEQVRDLAGQLGLHSLCTAAGALASLPPSCCPRARAAVLARVMRLGEVSILVAWDIEDLSI
ncbi:hypothetical protein [Anianabacter salinae]|uniref:hypothetical protein n=1 Tax=Anianabacter salinae TaxID=2851023 RepID=UPI00225E6C59|nr:hypothetical protein [Anianabacter salinae]MBV0913711.1 hypothetical protein [Anianabacter salinae]